MKTRRRTRMFAAAGVAALLALSPGFRTWADDEDTWFYTAAESLNLDTVWLSTEGGMAVATRCAPSRDAIAAALLPFTYQTGATVDQEVPTVARLVSAASGSDSFEWEPAATVEGIWQFLYTAADGSRQRAVFRIPIEAMPFAVVAAGTFGLETTAEFTTKNGVTTAAYPVLTTQAEVAKLMPVTYQAGATVVQTTPSAVTLVSGAAVDGEVSWAPDGGGLWTLTHTRGGTTQAATFNLEIPITWEIGAGGAEVRNEDGSYDLTGLATITLTDGSVVTVPPGVTVTVTAQPGQVALDAGEEVSLAKSDGSASQVTGPATIDASGNVTLDAGGSQTTTGPADVTVGDVTVHVPAGETATLRAGTDAETGEPTETLEFGSAGVETSFTIDLIPTAVVGVVDGAATVDETGAIIPAAGAGITYVYRNQAEVDAIAALGERAVRTEAGKVRVQAAE